jgi:thermitase
VAVRLNLRFQGLFLLCSVICGGPAHGASDVSFAVPGRLLAGRREGVDTAVAARTLRLHGAVVRRDLPALGVALLEVPAESAEAIRESLVRSGLFSYVEPDWYAHTAAVPNDPSYAAQWHLPRIQSPDAWSITTGAVSAVVAVVDSGVYGTHPDLTSRMVPGWNFVRGNSDTADVLGHGTAVAGTLGAVSNNHIGVAGVLWTGQIMPLVAVDDKDQAAYSNIAAAIQYAADHGVRVINLSVGGSKASVTLQNAVDYAWNKGSVVFGSAMNHGSDSEYYPAACDHAVAISAIDGNNRLAAFSNYGRWIVLSAPGTNILTTADGGGYGYWSGTSFATPIVAGVAALCLAINPWLSAADLVSILKQTTDDLGTPGFDTSFGWGRVNAFKAVSAARQLLPAPGVPRQPRRFRPTLNPR